MVVGRAANISELMRRFNGCWRWIDVRSLYRYAFAVDLAGVWLSVAFGFGSVIGVSNLDCIVSCCTLHGAWYFKGIDEA